MVYTAGTSSLIGALMRVRDLTNYRELEPLLRRLVESARERLEALGHTPAASDAEQPQSALWLGASAAALSDASAPATDPKLNRKNVDTALSLLFSDDTPLAGQVTAAMYFDRVYQLGMLDEVKRQRPEKLNRFLGALSMVDEDESGELSLLVELGALSAD